MAPNVAEKRDVFVGIDNEYLYEKISVWPIILNATLCITQSLIKYKCVTQDNNFFLL